MRPGQAKGPATRSATGGGGTPSSISTLLGRWINFPISYIDFAIPTTILTIPLWTPPAGTIIHMSYLKTSVAFTGGLITTYTLAIGAGSGREGLFLSTYNVFQAVAADAYNFSSNHNDVFIAAGSGLTATAIADDGLNTAIAGAATLQLYVSNLFGTALP